MKRQLKLAQIRQTNFKKLKIFKDKKGCIEIILV